MNHPQPAKNSVSSNIFQSLIRLSFVATVILTIFVAWSDIQKSQAAWWLIMSIMLLPLISFSHTVWLLHVRGLIWLCFVLCLYFIMATVTFITTTESTLHGLLALSTTLLFISILGYVRRQTKKRKLASATTIVVDSQSGHL